MNNLRVKVDAKSLKSGGLFKGMESGEVSQLEREIRQLFRSHGYDLRSFQIGEENDNSNAVIGQS